jgi:hypothetical protein
MFVLGPAERVMMSPVIDNPASCELHAVIHFFYSKNVSAAEIHREL